MGNCIGIGAGPRLRRKAAAGAAVAVDQARTNDLLSDEHFSVDGTLIEAWASQKSFQRKDEDQAPPPDDPGNPTVNFHGEKRSNDMHQSTTDPEARLARRSSGHESKLAYCGNVLIENRNVLVVDTELVQSAARPRADQRQRACHDGRRQRLRYMRVRSRNG